MRARRLPILLALLFIGVPILELYVLIQVGQVIGAWWTVLLLVADSALGAWLVKREWRGTWRALQQALRSGRVPNRELIDAALVVIGGTLLLTPGFVTDLFGFFALTPVTRPIARRFVSSYAGRRLRAVSPLGPLGPLGAAAAGWTARPSGSAPGGSAPGGRASGRGPVVTGEVVDD